MAAVNGRTCCATWSDNDNPLWLNLALIPVGDEERLSLYENPPSPPFVKGVGKGGFSCFVVLAFGHGCKYNIFNCPQAPHLTITICIRSISHQPKTSIYCLQS